MKIRVVVIASNFDGKKRCYRGAVAQDAAALPHDAAARLRQRLRVRLAPFEESPEERRLVMMTSAVIAAKQGRFGDSNRLVDECDSVQGARHLHFDVERAAIELEKARFSGDWFGALRLSEESLETAQRSGLGWRIREAARCVARDAWYCNDDERAAAAIRIAEDCAAPAPDATTLWSAALGASNPARSKELFDAAIAQIDLGEDLLARVMVRVGAALLLTARRRLAEARALALTIESSPLAASLDLLVESPDAGDYGIFKNLAARVAQSPLRTRQERLYLSLVRNQVRRGAEVLRVSERGLELLSALALLPAGSSKADLASAIWPALDGDAALNALKMCVSRTRAQLVDKDAIVSTKRGYALGDFVSVDAVELEELLIRARDDATNDSTRREVQEAVRLLETRDRRRQSEWSWFVPHAARLDGLGREFARLLARGHPMASEVLTAG
jgi:DNA-binding winged helix-turn-helix (wHTH) protein